MAAAGRHMRVTRNWPVDVGLSAEYLAIEQGDVLRVHKVTGPWLFVQNITYSPDWDRLISLPADSRHWIPECCGWVPISHCTLYLREQGLWEDAHYFGSAEAETEEKRPPMPTRAPPRPEESAPSPPPRSLPAVYPPLHPTRQEGVRYADGITLRGVFHRVKQPPHASRDPPDTTGQADLLAMGQAADFLAMGKAKAPHVSPKAMPKFADGAIESKGKGKGKDEGEEGTRHSQFLTDLAGIQAQRPANLNGTA